MKNNRPEPEWNESLEAMGAAPEHHKILLENERVRVLDSRIKPGEATPVHTHRWASVLYIKGTSDFIRYDAEGNTVFDSLSSQTNIEGERLCGRRRCSARITSKM